jgi:hypothetical protein
MRRGKILLIILFFLFLPWSMSAGNFLSAQEALPLQKAFPRTRAQIIDLRDMLKFMSRSGEFSLLIDSSARGVFRRKGKVRGTISNDNPSYLLVSEDGQITDFGPIGGRTFEEVLKTALPALNLGYGFFEGCLFVGRTEKIRSLWDELKKPLPMASVAGARLNAEFHEIDLSSIFKILEVYAGIGIKGAEALKKRVSLRAIDMPWERVLKAIVFLNDLDMVFSDFSITVTQ